MCKRSPHTHRIDVNGEGITDWVPLCGTNNFIEAMSDEPFVIQLQVYGNQNGGRWHDLWTHDRSAKVVLSSDGQSYAHVPGGQAMRGVVVEGKAITIGINQVSYNSQINVPDEQAVLA